MRVEHMKSKALHFDTTEEWLKWRKENITVSGSMIGSVAGLNKYQSPLASWERATERIPPLTKTLAMRVGNLLEDDIMQIFKDDYPETEFLRDESKILMYQSEEFPWLGSTPDNIAYYNGDEVLVELKTTRMFMEAEDIPIYYLAQVQQQMMVCGFDKCLLIWLNLQKMDYGFTVIDYDPDFANILLEAAIQFNDFVVNDIMPPPTNLTDFSKTEAVEGEIQADDDIVKHYYKLYELNEQSKDVKSKIDWHKLKIATFMKENTVIKSDDVKLVTYNVQTRKSVDTKKLKEEGLYDDYSKESSSRVMKINYKSIDKL